MRIERPHPPGQGARASAGVIPDRHKLSTPDVHNEVEQVALANVLTKLGRGRLRMFRSGNGEKSGGREGGRGRVLFVAKRRWKQGERMGSCVLIMWFVMHPCLGQD